MIRSKLSASSYPKCCLSTENPNNVNTITDKGFPRDMNDISKYHNDDIFNLFYE